MAIKLSVLFLNIPKHFRTGSEGAPEIKDLTLDIGAQNEDEVRERGIDIGEYNCTSHAIHTVI